MTEQTSPSNPPSRFRKSRLAQWNAKVRRRSRTTRSQHPRQTRFAMDAPKHLLHLPRVSSSRSAPSRAALDKPEAFRVASILNPHTSRCRRDSNHLFPFLPSSSTSRFWIHPNRLRRRCDVVPAPDSASCIPQPSSRVLARCLATHLVVAPFRSSRIPVSHLAPSS